MDKIPSVAERVAEMPTNKCPVCDGDGCTVEHDQNDPTGQTPIQVQCDFCHAEGKITTLDCVTNTLTAQHTALLTELRDSGLLEEKDTSAFENDPLHPVKTNYIGHNDLARAIKAHLDRLINPTNV